MSKVLKEFGSAMSVSYPEPEYPQDLIDQIVMPALRRSYDRARREDYRFAKATTGDFTFMTGPRYAIYDHVNGEPCEIQFDDDAFCQRCWDGIPQKTGAYIHQFGWYVACEIEEDEEDAIYQGSRAASRPNQSSTTGKTQDQG